MTYPVIEIFESVNGEGLKSGALALFIRLGGCNLRCNWCDTQWSQEPVASSVQMMTLDEITARAKGSGLKNITLTGGEPLLVDGVVQLVTVLLENGHAVEIETNGSVDVKAMKALTFLKPFGVHETHQVSLTVDYKLPSSGMNGAMLADNFPLLDFNDTIKLVIGSREDMEAAMEWLKTTGHHKHTHVLLSPVLGGIEPSSIVEAMKENNLSGVRLQLQLHKYIWDPQERGV